MGQVSIEYDPVITFALHYAFTTSIVRVAFLNRDGSAPQWSFREHRGLWKQGSREETLECKYCLMIHERSASSILRKMICDSQRGPNPQLSDDW